MRQQHVENGKVDFKVDFEIKIETERERKDKKKDKKSNQNKRSTIARRQSYKTIHLNEGFMRKS